MPGNNNEGGSSGGLMELIGGASAGRASSEQFIASLAAMMQAQGDATRYGIGRTSEFTLERGDVNKVIVPKDMNWLALKKYAEKAYEAEEKQVTVYASMFGIPADSLVAVWRTIQAKWGLAGQSDIQTFFGKMPPRMLSINTGVNEVVTIPYGNIIIPTWEGGEIGMNVSSGFLQTYFEGKAKFQVEFEALMAEARLEQKRNSIYAGKAIELSMHFEDDSKKGYSVDIHSPRFFEPPHVTKEDLILNPDAQFAFDINIFSRIENYETLAKHGIEFKHGIFLYGTYGTGKTLSASLLARMAVDHGITFRHLLDANYLAESIEAVRGAGKNIIFCEDGDSLFDGESRTEEINAILNSLDGIGSKEGMELMLIITSNNPDKINSAMMRAGRMDSAILMDHPEKSVIGRHLVKISGDYISTEVANDDEVCTMLAGRSGAFLRNIMTKAKLAAISRLQAGESHVGCITHQDIEKAVRLDAVHEQMAKQKPVDPMADINSALKLITGIVAQAKK